MTATQTRLRRGTNAQVNAMTPASSEVVHDTTNNRLNVGNGSTAGGFPIPNFRDLQQSAFITGTVGGTANAITLTLVPALAAYANGVRLIFKATANNTGATTINVNGLGARNIFKLSGTSLVACTGGEIISGAWYEIIDDGTQFQLAGGVGGGVTVTRQVFLSSGTYTAPSNLISADVEVVGGGGGGGAGANIGTGGGAGGYAKKIFTAAAIGASQTVTIGAGGASGAAGGTTTFGAILQATGGGGGFGTSGFGGGGGIGSLGDINLTGNHGDQSGTLNLGGNGGQSIFGGNGRGGNPSAAGTAAAANSGSGGGGAGNAAGAGNGGAGGSGICIVTEYRRG
jgi:hypothetical protein